MSAAQWFMPMREIGGKIYFGPLGRMGTIDLTGYQDPKGLANFIVASCTSAAIAPPVGARQSCLQNDLVSIYRYKALPLTVTPGGPIMATITEVFESEADNTRIIIETGNGGASFRVERLSAPVAAGSVDTEALDSLMKEYASAVVKSRDGDQSEIKGAIVNMLKFFDDSAAQQREAGKQEALDLTVSIGQLRERAEKAEAELLEARAEIEARKKSISFWIDRVNGLEAELAAAKPYDLKA